jgi:ATP-dependent RNA circularization protein (DNA/RNA ligase family)
MQAFNELGPDYLLGRIAREEELQWASENQLAETQGLVK